MVGRVNPYRTGFNHYPGALCFYRFFRLQYDESAGVFSEQNPRRSDEHIFLANISGSGFGDVASYVLSRLCRLWRQKKGSCEL